MSSANLTSKYRPQRFDEAAGQGPIKAVLSRASRENRIAPAYLFSGTRGVGKTTLARVFAKAVNCETAPTDEPCNKCHFCKAITNGTAVDVVEIDAASNRGIDDARRLKEDIGYAPIECRYKVFIIDEAHMLTREAFNALLKTLEEPPPHATFVLATTEPHKFPATIISRCQHYTFQRLTQAELEGHLSGILEQEGVSFEPAAVSLVARRGAGSVRDSMSLLGQVLALGSESLGAEDVRGVLGLAGQDIFLEIMQGIHTQDCASLARTVGTVLDRGLDLGFFLRELTAVWRNLFLLRQSGEKASDLMEMTDQELALWKEWAGKLSPAHVHACWQLTLEGQRRVLTSLEPGLALELLLFNLATLPSLMPVESLQNVPPASSVPSGAGNSGVQQHPARNEGMQTAAVSQQQGSGQQRTEARPRTGGQQGSGAAPAGDESTEEPGPAWQDSHETTGLPDPAPIPGEERGEAEYHVSERQGEPSSSPVAEGSVAGLEQRASRPVQSVQTTVAEPKAEIAAGNSCEPKLPPPSGPRTWRNFLKYIDDNSPPRAVAVNGIRQATGSFENGALTVTCRNEMHRKRLAADESMRALVNFARAYYGASTSVDVVCAEKQVEVQSAHGSREEIMNHPAVQEVKKAFDAQYLFSKPKGSQ